MAGTDVVRNWLMQHEGKEKTLVDNFDILLETLTDAAKLLEKGNSTDQVEGTKQLFKEVLSLQANLKAHSQALATVRHSYSAPAQPTDFAAALQEAADQHLQSDNNTPEEDPRYQELLQEIHEVHHPGEDVGPAPVDGDDDLQIERTNDLAPNATCPLSGRPIMELESPVEDQNRFVYEEAAIKAYIRSRRNAQVTCPVAGTSHIITVQGLKPARKVIRAQKRAQNAPTQTQTQRHGADDDVLDVD